VEALRNGHAAKRVLKRAAGQPAPATPSAPNEHSSEMVVLNRMTVMQVRERRWGDPFHAATPEEMATVVSALLRRAVPAFLMRR
jgi:hypothetical protein